MWFDNHSNALDKDGEPGGSRSSSEKPAKPDQFCIHRVDSDTRNLLTTVEYKPPHKLSVQSLREGLRPMNFWQEIVKPNTISTEEPEKSKYNMARLVGAAIVQEFCDDSRGSRIFIFNERTHGRAALGSL